MDIARLHTPEGAVALATASRLLAESGDQLAAATALRARFEPALATDALTQAALRQRARVKFGADAETMFFTRDGLEQATRPAVARRRARRLLDAGATTVADLGCGIGADLRHLPGGTGIEVDRVTVDCARHNAPAATVVHGDAMDFDLSRVDAAFCDPARRAGGRRVFSPGDYTPPWHWVTSLPERRPMTVLKLAPGIDPSTLPSGCELELVSVDGDVVEATAWCGPLATVPRRATIIKDGKVSELTGTGDRQGRAGPPGDFVHDPDGAVVRAHLVAEFADAVDGHLADPTIAYVWASRPATTPLSRCFAVDEVLPFSLKRLRAALRARGVGRLEILKRGSALDVQALRRELRLAGPAEASLLLTRVNTAPVAVIAHPVLP